MQVDQKERVGLCKNREKVEEYKEIDKFYTDKAASIPTQTLKLGEKATKPQTPTKEGYTFLGWYYNNKEYDFNSPVTSNIILTAKWQQN